MTGLGGHDHSCAKAQRVEALAWAVPVPMAAEEMDDLLNTLLATGASLKECVEQLLGSDLNPFQLAEATLGRLDSDPKGCVQGLAVIADGLDAGGLETFKQVLAGRLHPLSVGMGLLDVHAERFSEQRKASAGRVAALAERLGCDSIWVQAVMETGKVELRGPLDGWPVSLRVLLDDLVLRDGGPSKLPDGLWLQGAAVIANCPRLETLGNDMTVGMNLVVEGCGLVSLPTGLTVGMNLMVKACPSFDHKQPVGMRVQGLVSFEA